MANEKRLSIARKTLKSYSKLVRLRRIKKSTRGGFCNGQRLINATRFKPIKKSLTLKVKKA